MTKKILAGIGVIMFIVSIIAGLVFHLYTMYLWWYAYGILAAIFSFFLPFLSEIIMFFIAFDAYGLMCLYCLAAVGIMITSLVSKLMVAIFED